MFNIFNKWEQGRQIKVTEGQGLLEAMQRITTAMTAKHEAGVREGIEEMLLRFPSEWAARSFVVSVFLHLKEEQLALEQIAIGLALFPDKYVFHTQLARWLNKKEETTAAEKVLEEGWKHMRQHYPKNLQAQERAAFFNMNRPETF